MPASKPAVLTATDTPVEAHLRRVIETQPVCLTRIAADGTFLAINEAALSMLGAERLDQILGTSLMALVAPAHQDACRNFIKRISGGGRGSTEVEMTGLGGLEHVLQLHAVALSDPLDGISSTLCTFRDVTEHRRLESALVDAAAREKQAKADGEWADLTAQLDEARAAAGEDEEAAARVADLERELAEAQSRQQELEAERTRLLADLEQAEHRFEQAVGEHLARVGDVEAALEHAQARERDLAQGRTQDESQWKEALSDAAAGHERETAALRQALAELERTLEERRAGDADLHHKLAEQAAAHEQHASELRATIARLETAVSEATERAIQAAALHEADLAEWDRRAQELAASHTSDLQAWEQRAAEQAREHESALAAERARAETLASEVQALRDAASRQRDEHVAELERLEMMLAGSAAEQATLAAQLAEAATERAALERQVDRARHLAEAGRLAVSLAGDLDAALRGVVESSRILLADPAPEVLQPAAGDIGRGMAQARSLVRRITDLGARLDAAREIDAVAAIRRLEPSLAALLGPTIAFAVVTAIEHGAAALPAESLEHALLALIADRRTAIAAGQVTIEVAGVDIDADCAGERGVLPGPYTLVSVHMAGTGVDRSIPPEVIDRPAPDAAWRRASGGLGTVAGILTAAGGHLWLTREAGDALAFEMYLPGIEGVASPRSDEQS